jgi:abnormal spindle-like microcephaly-associated protein
VPSGVFETRYKAEMRALVLSRIMLLVFFLDRAKNSNILDDCPRLFTVSSEVKSSRDVLLAICRMCLSSEGDVVKHFSRIGLSVSYSQHPVDEITFKVSNLATDFRDGILLTRLAEIVTGASFKSHLTSLRLPAVSRLQKKFNVTFAISKITEIGIVVADSVQAHHIMDGHRDQVLTLMWCIIAHCCMEKLLKGEQVEQEIRDVIRSTNARRNVCEIKLPTPVNHEFQSLPAISRKSSPEAIIKHLLLRWSHAVCSSFGLHVQDFAHSFADGRIFCFLIHYYHPALIRRDDILATQMSVENSSGDPLLTEEQSSENERSNWDKVNKSIQELGGIPSMISSSNSMNPPDEKSVLLCLSYLCSRLMESSKEIFATILIQARYRRYSDKLLLERKIAAAWLIFQCWSLHKTDYYHARKKRFEAAVAKLERFIISNKGSLVRLRMLRLERQRQEEATIEIQVSFFSYIVPHSF